MDVVSACGDAEMCAIRSLPFFVPSGLRGFLSVITRRGVWRLAVFLLVVAASDSGDG
jgi:hypothetical protein